MTFGLIRYSLCGKLKLPVRYQRCCVVNIPSYYMRKLCVNETVRWTSTKANVKQTKKLFSQSKILRLYSLAKPEKNRLLCKFHAANYHLTSGFNWRFFVLYFRCRMSSIGVQCHYNGNSVFLRTGCRYHL